MVFDLHFPLFAILTAYLIVGAIASVAAGMFFGVLLDRIEVARSSVRAKRASREGVCVGVVSPSNVQGV